MDSVVHALSGLDRAIFLVINRTFENPVFDYLMPALSNKWIGFLAVGVVIPCLLLRYGRRAWPVIAVTVLAVALSDVSAGAIKHAVQRIRPCQVIAEAHLLAGCTRSFAMPSNHASNMFALATVTAILLPRWRWAVLILAGGVAFSRVYLGVHYPADVLIGALLGAALGYGLALLAKRTLPPGWTTAGAQRRTPAGSDPDRGACRNA